MSTIATTTNATPFQYPGMTLLARHPTTGTYICLVKASTADNYTFYKSTDSGGTWAPLATVVRTNLVDVGQIFLDKYNWMFWAYRTNESSQDRIYVRRMDITSGTMVPTGETLFASAGNGGVAGAVYSGLDVKTTYLRSNNYHYIAVAAGTNVGANQGVTLFAGLIDPNGNCSSQNQYISGTRQWLHAGTAGRVGPSMDIEHSGNGYDGTPNLWVAYGRTHLKLVKVPWSGSGWSGSPTETLVYSNMGSPNSIAGRWDGNRFLMSVPDPVNTSQVMLFERDRANSKTVTHRTGNHTTGVVRNSTISYDSSTGNVRAWAVGTSTAILYANDWTRVGDTWGGWGATAFTILGANADNYGAKRSSNGDARWGLYTAASGAPNTLTYTPTALSYSPNTPVWSSPPSGSAADVGVLLRLNWIFSDKDPGDSQSAYAVSRQIGAGALNYWRASDSTWQVAEVQNTSSSNLLFLQAGWAAASDAVYTYKVKVWDSDGNPSGYSAGLMIVPSTTINPALTVPTASQVIGTGTLPVAWTATEQTQYRITMDKGGILDLFGRTTANGWGTSDSGQAWSTVNGAAADYSTNATVGVHSNGTLNVLRTTTMDTGSSDHDVTIDCIINKATPTTAPVTQRVCARYADGNNQYIAQLVLSTAGAMTLQLLKRVGGTLSGDLATPVTLKSSGHASGESWRVRIQVAGSAVRAKAWPVAVSEPTIWYHDVTDTDLTVGTLIAIISRVDTGNTDALPITTNYDNLYVVPAISPDYDSNWVNDSTSRAATPAVLFATGDAWVISLRTKNNEGLESTSQRAYFTVNFTPPPSPTLVNTAIPSSGIIRVAITNPTPAGAQPAVLNQDLYRRQVSTGQTILNANPYFETNVTGWTAVGCTFVRSTAQFHEGVASGLITPDGVTANVYAQSTATVAVPAGATMRVQSWIRPTTANKAVAVFLHWYTVGDVFISTTVVSAPAVAATWIFQALEAMPPGPTAVKVVPAAGLITTPAAGDTAFVDGLILSVADLTTPVRPASGLLSGATYDDYQTVSGVAYEYRAVVLSTTGVTTFGEWTT